MDFWPVKTIEGTYNYVQDLMLGITLPYTWLVQKSQKQSNFFLLY